MFSEKVEYSCWKTNDINNCTRYPEAHHKIKVRASIAFYGNIKWVIISIANELTRKDWQQNFAALRIQQKKERVETYCEVIFCSFLRRFDIPYRTGIISSCKNLAYSIEHDPWKGWKKYKQCLTNIKDRMFLVVTKDTIYADQTFSNTGKYSRTIEHSSNYGWPFIWESCCNLFYCCNCYES